MAPSYRVEFRLVDVRDVRESVRSGAESRPGGVDEPIHDAHRDVIVGLAAGLRLLAIYPYRLVVRDGGLCPMGPNRRTLSQAAGY